jgi:hypothetical protein
LTDAAFRDPTLFPLDYHALKAQSRFVSIGKRIRFQEIDYRDMPFGILAHHCAHRVAVDRKWGDWLTTAL